MRQNAVLSSLPPKHECCISRPRFVGSYRGLVDINEIGGSDPTRRVTETLPQHKKKKNKDRFQVIIFCKDPEGQLAWHGVATHHLFIEVLPHRSVAVRVFLSGEYHLSSEAAKQNHTHIITEAQTLSDMIAACWFAQLTLRVQGLFPNKFAKSVEFILCPTPPGSIVQKALVVAN